MVGLSEVKKVTDRDSGGGQDAENAETDGSSGVQSSMHMLFSGNPGTAKTTVARLLSQVLKEEEVLKYGHIVECGRQDLVGKYVGWTAQIVESKFQAARGGILFIDEGVFSCRRQPHVWRRGNQYHCAGDGELPG